MSTSNNTKQKSPPDFKNLTLKQVSSLRTQKEREARTFERKLQSYIHNPKANPQKILRWWNIANKMWRDVNKLDRLHHKFNN